MLSTSFSEIPKDSSWLLACLSSEVLGTERWLSFEISDCHVTGPAGNINPACGPVKFNEWACQHSCFVHSLICLQLHLFTCSPALMGWGLSAPKENGWRFLWGSYFCLFFLILVNTMWKCMTDKNLPSVYGYFHLSVYFFFSFLYLSVCEGEVLTCMLGFNNAAFKRRHTVRYIYKVTGDRLLIGKRMGETVRLIM